MKLVFFDWNGTLLDDTPIWFETVQETFRRFGAQPPTMETYFRELEGDYLGIYARRGVTTSREELSAAYAEIYWEKARGVRLMPGARKLLRTLRERKIPAWLVTGQQESMTLPLLEKFHILPYFRGFKFHALNKEEIIKKILAGENVAPETCCLVGDSPSDIRHANKAGIVSIAFLNGHIPPDLLFVAKPRYTISELKMLLALV